MIKAIIRSNLTIVPHSNKVLRMTYSTTLSQKGQVTLQKNIRKKFKLSSFSKVKVIDKEDHIEIYPQCGLLSIIGKFKAPKNKSALKGREQFEQTYSRI